MRRPSSFDFLVGNRVARIGILCASVYELCQFVQRHDNALGGLSLIGIALYRYAARARARVATYRGWKQSWGQMTDSGTDSAPARERTRRRPMRSRVLLALWVILGLWLQANARMPGTPGHRAVGLAFAALTLWGVGAALRRLVRRAPTDKAGKPATAEFVARVVPTVPHRSPSLGKITSSLPAYCKRLMAAGAPT